MSTRRSPRPLRALAFVMLVALFPSACGDDANTDVGDGGDEPTRPGLAGEWVLVGLTVDGAEVPLPSVDIDMRIEAGEILGDGGCNGFGGTIDAADDGTLVLDELSWTEMACMDPAGVMEFESTYLQLLSTVDRWEVTPANLIFTAPTGEIRYEPAPPPVHEALMDTVWELDTFYEGTGPERAAVNRADMAGVTLIVGASETTIIGPGCDGTVIASGFDGEQQGEFVTGEGGDVPATPECGIVAEARDRLVASTGFMIDETRLTFVGAEGETLSLRAVAAAE